MNEQRLSALENVYYKNIVHALRMSGVIAPLMVLGLAFLVKLGVLDRTFYASDTVFYLILALLATMAIVRRITQNDKRQWLQLLVSAVFNLLGISLLMFVTGFASPFLIIWLVLYIAADTLYGTKAALLNLSVLLLGLLGAFLLHPRLTPGIIAESLVGVLMVCYSGYLISSIRKINEQQRLSYDRIRRQESQQSDRLMALVNAMGDAVINTNEHGVIRVYNAATLSLLDTNASLSGRRVDNYLNLKDEKGKAFDMIAYARLTDRAFSRRDLVHEYADGEKINLYVNVSPIRPSYRQKGVQTGFIFIIRDITKEKSLEQERDEFISVVSHELRTPIAITEGNLSNVQFILQKKGKLEPKLLEQAVATAHEQILYLANMVNDLSTLSRAERGVADNKEAVNVDELIQNVYVEYQPQAEKKKLHLNLDIDAKLGTLQTSRLYLEEIIQNFVTNAIKYTHEGSVTIRAHKQDGGVYFAVSDTGIGISKSDQKHIFEKFFRSEDYRTRETSGTGLGLYVAKKLAGKLGVTIDMQSRLNHGSTFSFLLKD